MAGFRSVQNDALDDALYNWAGWYKQLGSGRRARIADHEAHPPTEEQMREAYQRNTAVTYLDGKARAVDDELTAIQQDIGLPETGGWKVKETVAAWYAGTGTDEYEADGLGIPRSTFASRIDQVKRRIETLRENKLSERLSLRA